MLTDKIFETIRQDAEDTYTSESTKDIGKNKDKITKNEENIKINLGTKNKQEPESNSNSEEDNFN